MSGLSRGCWAFQRDIKDSDLEDHWQREYDLHRDLTKQRATLDEQIHNKPGTSSTSEINQSIISGEAFRSEEIGGQWVWTVRADWVLHFKISRFYNSVAQYYYFQNDLIRAAEFYEKALCLSVSSGQTHYYQTAALIGLAHLKWYLGDYLAGKALACETQKVAQLNADLRHEAHALVIEALCLKDLGSYPKAIAQRERAQPLLALCDMARSPRAQGNMNNLADIYNTKSEYIRAREIHTMHLSCAVEQDIYNGAFSCLNLAEIDISLDTPIQDVQKNIDAALWQAYWVKSIRTSCINFTTS
ncbi:hypothetical protein GGX14DRAFT_403643 [Mycena pura]|uniref:Uncharacterized protein n=1 Tax=Mycena pura TaxID=153505 RepID=A0AAD6UXE3_9AGAR|nr:hypothetical protein GGX14DRAFT_403643 [Mycena pura]